MPIRALLFVLLALPATPLAAAEPALGIMDASALENVPERFPVRVRPMANSEREPDLVGVFEQALSKAGYDRVEQGGYVFSFRLASTVERKKTKAPVQLEGQGGSRDSEDVSVRLRWKTGRDSEAGGERDRLLLARLQDPQGHVVWEARVAFVGGTEPTYDTVSAVAPGLVGEIGHEVIGKQLP